MAAYTTWAQVLRLYPMAADIESNGSNQTQLITDKSGLLEAWLRGTVKVPLPADHVISMACAYLVIDELRSRRITNEGELDFATFPHIAGKFTNEGIRAHAIISSIRSGDVVLSASSTERDKVFPPVIAGGSNTSTGTVEALLPHEYKGTAKDTFIVKCTTAGRADDGSAQFSVYHNNASTSSVDGLDASSDWQHLVNELYIRFTDGDQSGDEFVLNDVWTITAIPPDAESPPATMKQIEVYLG